MANKVKKAGMNKRMGAPAVGNRGSMRPAGRVKGGAKRVGRTGIQKPPGNAAKRGKGHEPMFNAMRADPSIVPSKGSKILKKPQATGPSSVAKLYEGMRGG